MCQEVRSGSDKIAPMIALGFLFPYNTLSQHLLSYMWDTEEGCAEIDRLAEYLHRFDVEKLILDLSVHSGRPSCKPRGWLTLTADRLAIYILTHGAIPWSIDRLVEMNKRHELLLVLLVDCDIELPIMTLLDGCAEGKPWARRYLVRLALALPDPLFQAARRGQMTAEGQHEMYWRAAMRCRLKADDLAFSQELRLVGVRLDSTTVPWKAEHVLCVSWVERQIHTYENAVAALNTQ